MKKESPYNIQNGPLQKSKKKSKKKKEENKTKNKQTNSKLLICIGCMMCDPVTPSPLSGKHSTVESVLTSGSSGIIPAVSRSWKGHKH